MKNTTNTPKLLYRFFSKREHRDQFLQGLIRFGSLERYRVIEDEQRKDEHEGKARGKYKTDKMMYLNISNETGKVIERGLKEGVIHITGDSPNKYFIVAMADERVDLNELSKFGKYGVKINNLEKFLDLLNKKSDFPWKVGKILLEQVRYDKDDFITMEGDSPHLPYWYYFAQKPASFAKECEWRVVLTGSAIEEINEEHPVIEIGTIEDIVSVVDL